MVLVLPKLCMVQFICPSTHPFRSEHALQHIPPLDTILTVELALLYIDNQKIFKEVPKCTTHTDDICCSTKALAYMVNFLKSSSLDQPDLPVSFMSLGRHFMFIHITLEFQKSALLGVIKNCGYIVARVSYNSLRASVMMSLKRISIKLNTVKNIRDTKQSKMVEIHRIPILFLLHRPVRTYKNSTYITQFWIMTAIIRD